ncbi:MAG TPA: ECF-type sigma factor [Gammaproteobacteria bacterium]|nr:ECF-type sigma factor [Gammaproteobacteria bacterium]
MMLPCLPTMSVTGLLQQWQNGDAEAAERLVPLVYAELRRTVI